MTRADAIRWAIEVIALTADPETREQDDVAIKILKDMLKEEEEE